MKQYYRNITEEQYTRRVKDILQNLEEIYDLKIKAIKHKIVANENREDIDVGDQKMQNNEHVYEKIIKTPEQQNGKIETRKHREAKAR